MAGFCHAQEKAVETFDGHGAQTTSSFQVDGAWSVQWTCASPIGVTVLAADGSVVVNAVSAQCTLTVQKGGTYSLQMADPTDIPNTIAWHVTVAQINAAPASTAGTSSTNAAPASASASTVATTTNAAPASAMPFEVAPPPGGNETASTGSLTQAQAHAVVVIKGDVAEGTGFLVHGPDGPAVITNLHVLAANPNAKIFTTSGQQVTATGLKGAFDRDLALISIQDNHYSYLDLATDISGTVQNGDEVITPGNSEGGEVVLDTKGTVLGVGPERIEFSNPIYHGNSGGPVFHTKSGKVIAIVTQGIKVRPQDDLDKASLANKNSAITGTMRYFGLRPDTVPKWETYDWAQFLNQTTFINNFHDTSRCLDSFMNGAHYEKAHVASADENGPPTAMYYLKNAKLVTAHDNYHRMSTDADESQRLDASREVVMDLEGVAGADMDAIQNPGNFYAFEAIRAQQELKYRQALQKEIENVGDKISDMGH